MDNQKIFYGAITIFYKQEADDFLFLVVQNSKTGNITFVSGAQEEGDDSLIQTAQRENKEELNLDPKQYKLVPTDIKHEFVFGPKKKERAGHKGSYQVFISDLSALDSISHTKELTNVQWLTEAEVQERLSFPDLKEIFIQTAQFIKEQLRD